MELHDRQTCSLTDILKEACRNFGCKEKCRTARLFNKNGLEIMDDDVQFIKNGDIYYVALDGEEFNNCAILDEYELGEVLGEGGFGQVFQAKHKETKKLVAIKFMDISDQRKLFIHLLICSLHSNGRVSGLINF